MSISGVMKAGALVVGGWKLMGGAKNMGPSVLNACRSAGGAIAGKALSAIELTSPVVSAIWNSAPAAKAAGAACSLYTVGKLASAAHGYARGQQPQPAVKKVRVHVLPANTAHLLAITPNNPLIPGASGRYANYRISRDRPIPTLLKASIGLAAIGGYSTLSIYAGLALTGLGAFASCPPAALVLVLLLALAGLASSAYAMFKCNMFDDTYQNTSEVKKFLLNASPIGVLYHSLSALHWMLAKALDD